MVPTALPFTLHWYTGVVPPLVGIAVKVTEEPAQEGLLPLVSAIETEGVTVVLIFIVMLLLVAVVGLAQLALEVITQLTTCPFVSALVVYVALLVPTFVPFTFHW